MDDNTTGVVGVAPAVLIISQLLYLGAAAGLRRNFKKWRHNSNEKRIIALFMILVLLSVGQTLMLFLRDKNDGWSTALMTAGPLPIMAPSVALMLYPIGEEWMRKKYRRAEAKWDEHLGNFIPIRILCNTWWKWAAYLATSMTAFSITGYAFYKTKNLYPLLSSLALPAMSTCLGAGLPLSKTIEELQKECRGNCIEDVILVPIIGHGMSTSIIIITYHKRGGLITIERRQSIIAHTNYSGEHYDTIRNAFRKRFNGIPEEIDEFIQNAKQLIMVVTTIGGWFRLSKECLNDRGRLRQALESKEVYNGCNTAMYCWTRAILEGAIRVGCSRQRLTYDQSEDLTLRSARELFSFVIGQDVGNVGIVDSKGDAVEPADVERMLAGIADTRGALAVAAMLLDRMSKSRDGRVPQLMTLGKGYDVRIAFRPQKDDYLTEFSQDIVLDDTTLHGLLSTTNAADRIRALGHEGHQLADKARYEIISAEFVPMNWTSFCIHRQHTFMYLLIYMGLSVIFVIFGQAQSDV